VIAHSEKPMILKKYPDRRLYNTATHTFMALDLADLVRQDIEFAIHETESGKDITRSVLLHIIVERERKATQNLLPTAFLRQLIRFYGHSMQMIVPVFLDVSLRSFIREQEKLRHPAISAVL
jgi:polyhydroxyalkanoate synthesis repressor PhaR